MAKPVFVQLEGSPHTFEVTKEISKRETEYTCSVCGIKGIRFNKQDYIEVIPTRKTKALIETCSKPVTKGEKKISYKLPVEYSADEIKEFQQKMVTEYFNIEAVEKEKERADSDFKARIKASEAIIHSCMTAVRDGKEELDVDCTVKYHTPTEFMKQIVRDDTGEVILEDKMDDDDCTFLNQLESGIKEEDGIRQDD